MPDEPAQFGYWFVNEYLTFIEYERLFFANVNARFLSKRPYCK